MSTVSSISNQSYMMYQIMQKTSSSSATDYLSTLSGTTSSNTSSTDLVTRSILSGLSGGISSTSTAALSKLLSEKLASQKSNIASLETYSKNSTAFYKDFNALTSELKNSSLALKNTDFTLSTPTTSSGTASSTTGTAATKDQQIAAIVANVKDFASDYNKLGTFFKDNAKLSSSVNNFATSFTATKYNKRAYESIGLNVDSTGKLSVDEKKLTAALNSDSKSVGQLIGGSGLANTAYNKTNAAINVSDKLYPALTLPSSASNLNSMGALLGLTLDFYA